MFTDKYKFIQYIHDFYGKGGHYPLVRDGKHLTKKLIKETLPMVEVLVRQQKWNWADGDSMDREFIREEMYERLMGFKEDTTARRL